MSDSDLASASASGAGLRAGDGDGALDSLIGSEVVLASVFCFLVWLAGSGFVTFERDPKLRVDWLPRAAGPVVFEEERRFGGIFLVRNGGWSGEDCWWWCGLCLRLSANSRHDVRVRC